MVFSPKFQIVDRNKNLEQKKSVLFITDQKSSLLRSSGENEIFALELGFKMIGFDVDYLGATKRPFQKYGIFVLFSTSLECISFLDFIPKEALKLVFPLSGDLRELQKKSPQRLRIIYRTEDERIRFRSSFPAKSLVELRGFFLRPSIILPFAGGSFKLEHRAETSYALAFLGADRLGSLANFLEIMKSINLRTIIYCDQSDQSNVLSYRQDHVRISEPVPYGSVDWFTILRQAAFFYEPNPRVTCSVLEALWLGKTVMSEHSETINSLLGVDAVVPLKKPAERKQISQKSLINWQVHFVLNKLLQDNMEQKLL